MAKGFIVYPGYEVEQERAYVYLYGRLENGESFLTINYSKPYFYIKKKDKKKALKEVDVEIEDTDFKNFEGEEISDKLLLYDGGVRDHSPSQKVLSSNRFDITETCTIFSRPEDNEILNPKDFIPKNILRILNRFVDITNTEVSKNDEIREKQFIKDNGIIDHGTFFLPRIMKGVYDVNTRRLKKLYEAGENEVERNWSPVIV